jgi:multidrug resistance protein, MATE family
VTTPPSTAVWRRGSPGRYRGPAAWRLRLRLLTPLAAPAVVVYMLIIVMSSATKIFCGQVGNVQLAAASLGNNGIQVFAYGLMVRTLRLVDRVPRRIVH